MKLYEIKEAILNGVVVNDNGDVVNPETGEKLTKEEFEALGVKFDEGVENLCLWIKDLAAEIKALKEEEDIFKARRESAARKKESLTKYVAFLLDGAKFKTTRCTVSYRNNKPSCVVSIDPKLLPEQFQNIKVEAKKTELAEYIKAGNTIAGVELVASTSTLIR